MADLVGYIRRLSAGDFHDLVLRTNMFRERVLQSMADAELDAVICAVHPLPALRHGGSYLLGSVAGCTLLWSVMGVPTGSAAVTRVREDEQAGRDQHNRDRVEALRPKLTLEARDFPLACRSLRLHGGKMSSLH